MHVLPQLRKLERRYPVTVQVISVHSPKFPTERENANLRQAVLRHRIEHPVVNDRDFGVWQQFGARAWPTIFFIDPTGAVIGRHEGEILSEMLEPVIDGWLEEYEAKGLLTQQPLGLTREQDGVSALSFPGKVEFDEGSGRLFVADTNNDRIIIANLDGVVERVVGSGDIGRSDGPRDAARFNQPQGLAVAGGGLYVADLENHLIRLIDLGSWETETVAGVGEQARKMPSRQPALSAALNSPWDVAHHDGRIYIAMAGCHQIWALDPDAGVIEPWAGSMAEGIVDGPRASAELAQPSGLSVGDGGIVFADSESSAVRELSFGDYGAVRTILGTGLFDFGDRDGVGGEAKLQHLLDVAWAGDDLYIADSFNHKIKRVYPKMQSVTTLCGGQGYRDGALAEALFNEPGGLCAGPGRSLIVADTNNHQIRLIDLNAETVRTIALKVE